MPRAFRLSEEIANAQVEIAIRRADGGYLRIYQGQQPESVAQSANASEMLVELPLADPAYGPVAGGVASARAVPLVLIKQSGRASWFRIYAADGITPCWDGSVGTIDSDLLLVTTRLDAGVQFSLDGLTFSAGPV